MKPANRIPAVRLAFAALAATVLAGLLTLGISAPAFAVTTVQVTIKVVNKAGTAVPTSDVSALQDSSGVEPYGDVPVAATAVTGKPGYFTATLVEGDTYTLVIIPTGASQLDGNEEYMGGGQDLAQAQTFVPSATDAFVTATFATEGEITGKVTSPTGAALKDAEAEAFVFDGGQWIDQSYTTTNSSGVYTLTDLQPGSYVIKFFSPTDAYPPVYSGDATTIESATPVSVLPEKPATSNAKFAAYTGAISGVALVNFDGEDYSGEAAVATAYPVLTQSGGEAQTIDLGHGISSAAVGASGEWTIKNVPPGSYVVNLDPAYYNEADQWVGTTDPSQPLSSATIITLTPGQKVTTGETELSANDNYGGQPDISVYNGYGTQAVGGAEVSLTSDATGYVVATGTSSSEFGSTVPLQYGDGTPVASYNFQPGWYTLHVIDPTGAHEPYTEDIYYGFYDIGRTIYMEAVTQVPGFASQPSITETDLQVGTTYTVAGQAAARSDATLTYQWLRDGQPIYGAVGTSYTSTGADFNHQLSVRVTASSFGFDDVSTYAYVQGGDEIAGPAPTNNGDAPSISPVTGAAFVGTTLQANAGGWSETGLHFDYQWQSNGVDVGTNSSTYVVAPTDINEPITVDVTATKTGYDPGTTTPSPVAVVPAAHPAPLNTKAPAVTKTTSHGTTTYSATAGSWSLSGLGYAYQWSSGGAPLPMGTTSKYSTTTPSFADPLELTVTTSRTGYLPGAKTIIVQKGTNAFTQTVTPTVHDTEANVDIANATDAVQVGEHLVVSAHADWSVDGDIAPDGYSYQWYRQVSTLAKPPVAISGATASTYTVGSADVGQLLSVKETTVSVGYTAASVIADAGLGTLSQLLLNAPPAIAIHGVGAQGQVLTAAVGAWPTTGVVTSYQWLDCPATSACDHTDTSTYLPISKATKSTLAVLASYGYIALQITGTKAGYAPATVISDPASLVAATTVVNLSSPTISGISAGDAHVGAKLTAVSGKFSVSGLAAHYVWQVQECVPSSCDPNAWTQQASGAGSSTSAYVPTVADLGGGDWSIRVEETIVSNVYTDPDADDSAPVAIQPGVIVVTKTPALTTATGSFGVGAGTYSPTGGATSVQWYTDASLDPAGPTVSYDPVADANDAIYAVVTYGVPGYADAVRQVVAHRGAMATMSESVTGADYGDSLGVSTANPFTDAAGTTISPSYQWYSNGAAIKGATGSTFLPSTAYIGHHIQVKVTGTTALYNTASVESPNTFVLGTGALGTLTSPTISYPGTLQPGTVMTSVLGTGYVPSAVTIARQWQRSADGGTTWVNVSKATAATYTPLATDVGAEFRTEVVSSKSGYVTQTQYSEAETVQYSPALATFAPPSVTGSPSVGQTLVANPGTWDVSGLTYTYQWYRDDVAIPGASASTFTPDYTFATDTLSFTVTASRVGYQPVTVTSNDQVIAPGTIAATTAPKISLSAGNYVVSTGSWAADGLTFSYQWQVGGIDATGVGATTDTYTRAPTDTGVLSVVITAQRTGYTTLELTVNGPTLESLV